MASSWPASWDFEMKERLIVIILTVFDRIMDLLTFGRWSRVRGDEKVVVKFK